MVQRAVTTVLVGLVLLSTQHLLLVQTVFVLRRAYVVEYLCVNRDRPEMKCNGRCHLAKHLREHQQHEHQDRQSAVMETMLAFALWTPPPTGVTAPPPHRRAYPPATLGRASDGVPALPLKPPDAS